MVGLISQTRPPRMMQDRKRDKFCPPYLTEEKLAREWKALAKQEGAQARELRDYRMQAEIGRKGGHATGKVRKSGASSVREKVVVALSRGGWMRSQDLADALGVSTTTTNRHLADMARDGVAVCRPLANNRSYREWHIKQQGIEDKLDVPTGTETTELSIMGAIKAGEKVRARDVAARVGMSVETCRRYLSRLQDKGVTSWEPDPGTTGGKLWRLA